MAVIKLMFNFTFGEDPRNHLLAEELEKLAVESTEFTESSAAAAVIDFIPLLEPFVRKQVAVVEPDSVEGSINFVYKVYTNRKHFLASASCTVLCVRELLENLNRNPMEIKRRRCIQTHLTNRAIHYLKASRIK